MKVKVRAVICDVYKTLLEVSPPPLDSQERWAALCREAFPEPVPIGLLEFNARCELLTAREHVIAKAAGIGHPEICWPAVAAEALPGLRNLPEASLDDFLLRHACLCHTLRLMTGAADALRELARLGTLLGIASNAQRYTLREVGLALEAHGLSLGLFLPSLTFWSFEHGFSKPNPHVIRLLTARLGCLGIAPCETLMVGDRIENDIEPARVQGWQTWHFSSASTEERGGDWPALIRNLKEAR
jgi:putative hydrolase of the HAD superfamily